MNRKPNIVFINIPLIEKNSWMPSTGKPIGNVN